MKKNIFFILICAIMFLVGGSLGIGASSKKGGVFLGNLSTNLEKAFVGERPVRTEVSLENEIKEEEGTEEGKAESVVKIEKPVLPKKKSTNITKKVAAPKNDIPIPVPPKLTSSTLEIKVTSTEAWCPWKTSGLSQGDVLINEIAWMGSESDPEAEWIELKNARGWEVDLGGWQLVSKEGKLKLRLISKTLLPGEFYVLAKDVDEPEVRSDMEFKGDLKNSGDWLKLFGPGCRFMDEINALNGWPSGNKKSALTMERKVAEAGWQNSQDPGGSPYRQNYIETVVASSSKTEADAEKDVLMESEVVVAPKILIASVQTSGAASDDDRIALYNTSPDSLDISGWKIRKRTKSGSESSVKSLSGEIPGLGYFIWTNSKYAAGADATSTQTVSSDNSIALMDGDNKVVDAVAWGSGHVGPYVEGSAFPTNPTSGGILQRRKIAEVLVDSGDNATDFEMR